MASFVGWILLLHRRSSEESGREMIDDRYVDKMSRVCK